MEHDEKKVPTKQNEDCKNGNPIKGFTKVEFEVGTTPLLMTMTVWEMASGTLSQFIRLVPDPTLIHFKRKQNSFDVSDLELSLLQSIVQKRRETTRQVFWCTKTCFSSLMTTSLSFFNKTFKSSSKKSKKVKSFSQSWFLKLGAACVHW